MCSLVSASTGFGQTNSSKLKTFQRFVNGQVPIQEAVVYRKISEPSGYVNQDWWRFGIQGESWYCQRLQPDQADPSKLVPHNSLENGVAGASVRELWTVCDQFIHVADRAHASGSTPDRFGGIFRNLMMASLSLGISRDNDPLVIKSVRVKWDGLKYKSVVSTKRKDGHPAERGQIEGTLTLDNQGFVASLKQEARPNWSPRTVTYEYPPNSEGIPIRIVVRDHSLADPTNTVDDVIEYVFLSLKVGTDKSVGKQGYLPSMFADKNLPWVISYWTNGVGYSLHDGEWRRYVEHRKKPSPEVDPGIRTKEQEN